MRALVGCECSGRVRRALRGRGYEAYSCDLKPAEDAAGEYHIQGDVMEALKMMHWDLVILHPDCTAMALSGNRHYAEGMLKYALRLESIEWTKGLWEAAKEVSPRVALENPASVIFPELRKLGARTQFIQPHQFGHPEFKATGFALHGLPELEPTNPLRVPESP